MKSGDGAFIILGFVGPLAAYICISLSILLSPSFSWHANALSDLGHSLKSPVAPIYNLGLLIAGFLITLYAARPLMNYAKCTGASLMITALLLQAVAVFDEVYGVIHSVASVLFFMLAGVTCIIYAVERRSILAAIAFVVGLLSWVLWWAGVYRAGVAVPEIISALAVTAAVYHSAIKLMYYRKGASKRP